jgi:hypothetical protein
MSQESQRTTLKTAMTPLWVISLFVSLTEIVTGIAVTKAAGGVQIALTAFVIAFPLLVASAFFIILWSRPFVFYPPTEFSGAVNVNDYVKAMGSKVEVVRADLQAEAGNLRASLGLEVESFRHRLSVVEDILTDLTKQTENTQRSFEEYKGLLQQRIVRDESVRSAFEENSKFRIHVVSATNEAPLDSQDEVIRSLVEKFTTLGFRTSSGALGSFFYFPLWDASDEGDSIKIIYKESSKRLAEKIQALLQSFSISVPATLVPLNKAVSESKKKEELTFVPEDVDLTVAYCMKG